MARERTPDGRRAARSTATADATAGAAALDSGVPGAGGVRLRRGSTSFNDQGNGFSSNATLNTANLYAQTNSGAGAGAGAGVGSNGSPPTAFRRRSSNFSDYSQDARDLLNPTPMAASAEALRHSQPTSSWDSLPLAFALLPAVGGLLVQGGGSFVTDLMLLALGAIFLHWSVTQPWTWYHSAQQIREEHETSPEFAVHSDSDSEADDGDAARPSTPTPLADVQEEDEGEGAAASPEKADKKDSEPKPQTPDERVAAYNKKQRERRRQERRSFQARQDAALRELYRHEVMALLSCFVSPILGAYLLHALRGQLTRPSEGLISNYNLTIFMLGAEVRPLRHLLQLVQARTLHLQRIVHANPYREEEERYRERREQEETEQNQTLSDLLHRLDSLEQQTAAAVSSKSAPAPPTSYFPSPTSPPSPPSHPNDAVVGTLDSATHSQNSGGQKTNPRRSPSDAKRERDQLLRDVRAQLQPELDTLARALRRTHKQQTLLEGQIAAKFRTTDQRLGDAVSLASAAAGGGRTPYYRRRHFGYASFSFSNVVDAIWATASWAFEAAMALLLYVPRKATIVAAVIVTFPMWALQSIFGGWSKDDENADQDNTTSRKTGKTGIVGSSLRAAKKPGADSKLPREYDYEYAPLPPSRARQHRFGLT